MSSLKISVIIPVKNEEEKIEQCLKSIFNQSNPPFEVIIVDGHSSDKTVEKAEKYPIILLYEDHKTRAGACQVGLENSRGEIIAFTDADCIPQCDWLENLIKEFNSDIVGVGGGIKPSGKGIWEESINLATSTFLGSAKSVQGRLFKTKRYVKSISGCNSAYRRDDIIKAGGFKTDLLTAEDTELNNRLAKFGKLVFTPNAIVIHNPKRGVRLFAKRMYQYGYGRGKSKLIDLQVIPPLILPFALLTLPIYILTKSDPSIQLFFVMFTVYFLLILIFTVMLTYKQKNKKYIFTIPIVFMVEHVSYSVGLWRGFLIAIREGKAMNLKNPKKVCN
ncbi:MAG: glycosyltransferase [Candidatus Methanoperedens sp.]